MLNAGPKFIEKLRQGEKPTLVGVLTGNWLTRTDGDQVKDDTEADWAANNGESNVDYVSTPPASGDVILKEGYEVLGIDHVWSTTNTIYAGGYDPGYKYWYYAAVRYIPDKTGKLKSITITLRRAIMELTGGVVSVSVRSSLNGSDLITPLTINYSVIPYPDFADFVLDFSSQNFVMNSGDTYFIFISNNLTGGDGASAYMGVCESIPNSYTKRLGYLGFDWNDSNYYPALQLKQSGYQPVGWLTSRTHELVKTPEVNGIFNSSSIVPSGCSVTYDLFGSDTGAFTGEETEISNVQNGQTIILLKKFWRQRVYLVRPTADLIVTPTVYYMSLTFPNTQYQLCMSSNRFASTLPIIDDISILEKQLDPVSRITYGMDIEVSLQDKNAIISKLLEHNYAVNMQMALELAYELSSEEYTSAPFYKGWITNYQFEPNNYPDKSPIITLSLRDVHSELLTIVPQRQISGEFEPTSDLVLEYDGIHMIDVAWDLLTNQCKMSPSMLDTNSFTTAKEARSGYVVRRKDDTTKSGIYNTQEVRKYLFDLCLLTDTYLCPQEDSKFYLIPYNPGAAASADWAEGKNFRTTICAGNLEDGRITRCLVTYDWKGIDNAEDDVSSYNGAYLVIDEDAEEAWSSTSTAKSKLLEIITPWLGPEAIYGGKTLAYQIAYKYVSRWAWGATLIQGVTPLTEYLVQVGDIIKLQTPYFLKKGIRGIKKGQSKSFFVISKRVDIKKFQIEWRLMEAV